VTGQRFMMRQTGSEADWASLLRFGAWSIMWLTAHILGGIVTGGALGAVGSLLPGPFRIAALAVLSALCLIWALAELKVVKLPMPQWPRQVQERWLVRLPWNLIALGYGFQLGSAVATRIKSTIIYAALFCALLVGSPLAGAFIMAIFGAARGLPALIVAPLVDSPERSIRLALRIDDYAGAAAKVNAGILVAAGVAVAWDLWALTVELIGR
jgi:sulfite exporter TauE/SafE